MAYYVIPVRRSPSAVVGRSVSSSHQLRCRAAVLLLLWCVGQEQPRRCELDRTGIPRWDGCGATTSLLNDEFQ